MKKLDLYWETNREWWHYDEAYNQILNDDAPEEAKESYAHYLEQLEKGIR